MKFYIDSANINEIKEAHEKGWVDGVTTNPSLVAKTGISHHKAIRMICKEIQGLVSAEVVGISKKAMVEEGLELSQLAPNVVVKIPMSEEGLMAVRELTQKGIKTNVTLVFSPLQALMVAKVGATLISPFVGRLDDISTSGMALIQKMQKIYKNYNFKTQILVASIRHPLHILKAALIGADIVTVPFKVLKSLVHHPLTDKGIAQFVADAGKIPKL